MMSVPAIEKVLTSAPKAAPVAAAPKAPKNINVKKYVDAVLPPSKSAHTSMDRVFPYVLLCGGAILLYASIKGLNPVQVMKNVLQGKDPALNAGLKGGVDPNPPSTNQSWPNPPTGRTAQDGWYVLLPNSSAEKASDGHVYRWEEMGRDAPAGSPAKPTTGLPSGHEWRWGERRNAWAEFWADAPNHTDPNYTDPSAT